MQRDVGTIKGRPCNLPMFIIIFTYPIPHPSSNNFQPILNFKKIYYFYHCYRPPGIGPYSLKNSLLITTGAVFFKGKFLNINRPVFDSSAVRYISKYGHRKTVEYYFVSACCAENYHLFMARLILKEFTKYW